MAIGVNGNINNPTDIQRLLKGMNTGKGGRSLGTKKAPGMGMNESIFNNARLVSGHGVRRTNNIVTAQPAQGPESIVGANTDASVRDVSSKPPVDPATKPENVTNPNGEDENGKIDLDTVDFDNLTTLTDPQLNTLRQELQELLDNDCPFFLRKPFESKLAKVDKEIQLRGEQDGDKVSEDNKEQETKSNEALKAAAEEGADVAKSGAAGAQKGTADANNMSKSTTDLQKTIESAEAKLLKDQKKAEDLVNKNTKAAEAEGAKIDDLTTENLVLTTNITTINSEIITTQETGGEGSSDKINDLSGQIQNYQTRITVNNTNIGKSSVAMHRYTANSGATIRTLTKANKVYTKTVTAAQQQIQQNQEKSEGIMETMEKINDISSKVALAGSITKYTGIALSHTGFGASAGAAMITAGTIAETAGNYGVCAANIGKTAVYAAQGNIMGAMTSVGTAVMSGATAVGNTQKMMAAADAAKSAANTTTSAASQAAESGGQQAVNNAGNEAMTNMTTQVTTEAAENGGVKLVTNTTLDINEEAMKKSMEAAGQQVTQQTVSQGVSEVGQNTIKGMSEEIGKDLTSKGLKRTGLQGFANGVKSAMGDTTTMQALMGLGTSLQSAAAMFQSQDQGQATVVTRSVSPAHQFHRRKIA